MSKTTAQPELLDKDRHANLVEEIRESQGMQDRPKMLEIFNTLLEHNRASRDDRLKALEKVTKGKVTENIRRCREVLEAIEGSGSRVKIKSGSAGARPEDNPDIYTLWVHAGARATSPAAPAHEGVEEDQSALKRFWACHEQASVQGCIVVGEPFFLKQEIKPGEQPGTELFVRNPDINTEAEAREAGLKGDPDYPYLRRGEVLAMLEISNYFTGRLKPIRSRNGEGLETLRPKVPHPQSSMIIIGNSQSCGALTVYEGSYEFLYYSDGRTIYRRNSPSTRHSGRRFAKRRELTDKVCAPVLVSRRPGKLESDSWITIVATDSGRAMERVGEILCSPTQMEKLFRGMPEDWPENWPSAPFQIVIEVDILLNSGREDSGSEWRVKGDPWRPSEEPGRSAITRSR